MKEELQGKLVEILTSIQTAAGKASDFAMAELPDIAQSYIAYGRAYATAIAVLALIVFCCGFWAVALVNAKHRRADAEYAEAKLADRNEYRSRYFEASDVLPLPYIPFIVGGVALAMSMGPLFLVWFAPKVWLLKEIAGMLR